MLSSEIMLLWDFFFFATFVSYFCSSFLMLQILFGVNWHSSPDITESIKLYVTVWDPDPSNLNLHWIMHSGLFSTAESCKNMELWTSVIREKHWMSKRIGCVTKQLYNSPSFYSVWNKYGSFTKVSQSIAYPAIILLTIYFALDILKGYIQ